MIDSPQTNSPTRSLTRSSQGRLNGASSPTIAFENATQAQRGTDVSSLLISTFMSALILFGFLSAQRAFMHWFVVPLLICGSLIGHDAVQWLRRRYTLLDPYGILGVVGYHFFFIAPLLHVSSGYWLPDYVVPPSDWRPWVGQMAWINALSILAYFLGRRIVDHRTGESRAGLGEPWKLNLNRFKLVLAFLMGASIILQTYVYSLFGGIIGYIQAYTARTDQASFQGLGWMFMFSEAFPMLFMFAYVVYAKRTHKGTSWTVIAFVLLIFMILRVFFGGLRGSRANYVWPMFWSIGMIHLWLRPLSRKIVLLCLVCFVFFMYGYGLYKHSDSEGQVSSVGQDFNTVILGDLDRSNIQAYLLYRLSPESGSDYKLSWGRTYIGAFALLVPRALWPDRPPTKVKEGTQAVFGMSAWSPGHFTSSFAYGLGGETMLNFGPAAIPIAYGIFGIIVGLIRKWCLSVQLDDIRTLMIPFLVSLCLYLLVWDSDVTLYYIFTTGLLPLAILAFCSSARERPLDFATTHS